MKKLTALILTLSMLLSLFGAMPVLADAESDRVESLKNRDEYYYPIEYNKDIFATYAEILEFGVFETKVNGAYPFPEKDLEGNPLSASGNWLSTKGIDAGTPTDIKRRNSFFLIDSVEGVSDHLKAEAYKSPTDYTKVEVTRWLANFNINGNPNMELVKTDEDGTKHYMYNAGNVKYQMGPIGGTGAHRTADGGYNARALSQYETVTFARTQKHAENLSFMLAYEKSGDANNALAGLEKVTIKYNDGKPAETKYIVVTTMQNVTGVYTPKDGGDRFGRILVAVPKTKDGAALDHTSGDVLDANDVHFTTENVKTITGFDATLEDVVFPADFVVGESMPIADKVINSNPVASYGDVTNPSGYANHYTFDFGEDVKEITYSGSLTYALNYPGAIKKGNYAYIPVTINGASEDYAYYARFGRPCNYAIYLMGATSYAAPVQIKIDAVNAKIAEAETLAELEAIEAEIAELVAEYDKVLESDFDISVIASKKAELERMENLKAGSFVYVDMAKYGNADIYAAAEDIFEADYSYKSAPYYYTYKAGLTGAEFNSSNSFHGALQGNRHGFYYEPVMDGDAVAYYKIYPAERYTDETVAQYHDAICDADKVNFWYNGNKVTVSGFVVTADNKNITGPDGNKYQMKFTKTTKSYGIYTYYNTSTGAEVSTKDGSTNVCNVDVLKYHNGKPGYINKSLLAENKNSLAATYGYILDVSIFNNKKFVKDANPTKVVDRISGNVVDAYYATYTTEGGQKFRFGPVMPEDTSAKSGYTRVGSTVYYAFDFAANNDTNSADYINVVLSFDGTTAHSAVVKDMKVTYLDAQGQSKSKEFLLVGPRTAQANYSATQADVKLDDTIGNVLYSVPDTLSDFTYATVNANKTAVAAGSGITYSDLSFDSNVPNSVILPTEYYNGINTTGDHSFSVTNKSSALLFFRVPVSDLGEITNLSIRCDGSDWSNNKDAQKAKSYHVDGAEVSSSSYLVPVNVEGGEAGKKYFVVAGKAWGNSNSLYAVTFESGSSASRIEKINTQLNAAESKEEVITALNAMKALVDSSNGAILAKDFDTASATAKLNEYILADIEAAKSNAEVDAIDEEVDGYVLAYGIDVTVLKTAIADKKAELDRVAGLITGERYTPVKLSVAAGKNANGLVYGFETPAYTTFANTEENAAIYNIVKDKKYVTTRLLQNNQYVAQTVAQWQEYDKTHTGLKTGIQYYSTDLLNDKNEYTTPAGTKYVIDTFGDTDYNSAYLNHAVADNYVAEFDGVTPYKSVKLLLSAVDEPIWNGSSRNARAVAATINYADGTSEKKLVFIGSLYGYGAALSAKLKDSAEIRGNKLTNTGGLLANEKNINIIDSKTGKVTTKAKTSVIYTNLASSNIIEAGKTTWSPFEYAENIWVNGKFYSSANANATASAALQAKRESYTVTQMADGAGHFTSVTLDTKGKAITSVTIGALGSDAHFNELCGEYDAFRFSGDANSWYYRVPLSNEVAKELLEGKSAPFGTLYKFDETGAVETETQTVNGTDYQIAKGYSNYTVEDCDVYLTVHAQANSHFVVLHAATGEKKYANLMDYIKEAEAEMVKITVNSSMEDVAYAENLINEILADGKVKENDFDAEILATFKATALAIKEKANVSGTIEMTYVAGTKPVANVTIKNLSALAGKPYKVIIACYDENDNLLGTTVKDCVSTTEKASTFTVEAKNLPDGTAKVKGFLWKDFGSLMPLATSDEAAPSSYALDRFFNTETGEYIYDESGELNVVFIGDSLTQGASTYDGDALSGSEKLHWTNVICEYFAEKTGKRVNLYNAGVGGTQTSFVAKMVSQTAEDKNADIVFIENVNDLNTNTTNSQKWTENLVRSLSKLDKKPVVILAHAISPFQERDTNGDKVKTVEEGKEWQIQHANAKDVVAQAYNLASVDYVSYYYENTNGFDTNSDWMQEDYGPSKIADKNVHPLTAGYTRFGQYIVSQIDANPSAYITRIKPAEDVAVMHADVADNNYVLTYPTSSRFTYKGFNLYTKANKLTGYTTKDAEYLVDWKYNFPHGGAAQARVATEGAEFEFTTEANYIEIVHSSPYLANTRADFDIYVDGNLYLENKTTNAYANVLNTTSVTIEGEGLHKVKVVVKPDATKKVFNFAYLVEQK